MVTRFIFVTTVSLILSCATPYKYNPWETPTRGFNISSSAEQQQIHEWMQPCVEFARNTFDMVTKKYTDGLPQGSRFLVIIFDDQNFTKYLDVHSINNGTIKGRANEQIGKKGKYYAAGDLVPLSKSDIFDWYIIYLDRPPEGNLLGRFLLLKQDGLAPGACDPHDIELKRFRFFSKGYSFVPPGTEGWELSGAWEGTDMSMQEKDENLDEINTISSRRYKISPINSDQALIEKVTTFGRYGDEEGVRYNVVKLEADIFPNKETRCARADHVVEDKKALLSKSGKRGLMIRDVQALLCVHPADKNVAVALIYSHRHHPGKRDSEFINKANKVFESLAFTTRNY